MFRQVARGHRDDDGIISRQHHIDDDNGKKSLPKLSRKQFNI